MSFLLAWGSGLATPVHAGDPEERDPRGDEQPPRSPAWLPAGTELHLPGDGQSRPPAWSPARQATMYDQPDQAARLELVIKRIIVHDDGELFDEGELRMTIRFWRVNDGCPADKASEECISELARSAAISFSADDGDSVLLDRVFPADGDTVADDSIGPGIGIPVQVGQAYGWEIRGVEVDDVTSDDSLGWLRGQVHAGNGWGPPGAYIERGTRVDGGSPWRPSFAFRPAHFSVQYEIRHAALPDLRPAAIRVDEPPDARQPRLCATFQKDGLSPSGAAQIVLAVDGATISTSGLEGLAPGQSRERCDWAPPFAAGRYTLTARVDADGAIPETNEANNEIQQEYVRTIADEVRAPGGSGATTSGANNGQPPPGPVANATTGPSPAPTTPAPRNSNANVDLTVSAIRVNGRVPDGKDDCQDGKNDVAVVVRNTGKADAGAVVVRLVVDKDDDRAANRTVNGLKADEEREVRFDDVRLKKGEHELEAIADAKEEVAESDEGNNARTVTAACKDED